MGVFAVVLNTLVRWLTFVLSLTAAIVAAYVTTRGYEPRWRLYHKYAGKILSEGWLYMENAGKYGAAPQQRDQNELAALLTEQVCGLVSAMNKEYDAIAHASRAGHARVAGDRVACHAPVKYRPVTTRTGG